MLLRFPLPFLSKGSTKESEQLDTERDIATDVSESDFIPQACHFSADTLLTKNGELMQTIRIRTNESGHAYEAQAENGLQLRDLIRKIMVETVENRKYAFWFHTVRRRVPISHQPTFREPIAQELHNAWQKEHRWHYQYVNEIYISVLIEGQTAHLFDSKDFKKGFIASRNRAFREDFMEERLQELTQTVDRIVEGLRTHSDAQRIGIVRRDGAGVAHYFSEPLEFLHFVCGLMHTDMPVEEIDLSQQLAQNDLTFGFDAMESRAPDGRRRFGGILTLKGYPELSPSVLDKCLQLPEELVVAQSFDFVPADAALARYKDAQEALSASLDPTIPRLTGMEEMILSNRGRETDYGEQQLSITIIRDQYRQLDDAIGEVQEAFSKLGLITIREDVKMEEIFWSQLPGNFEFLRRKSFIPAARAAGLCRLNHFPSGTLTGNHWGNAVAILPTRLDTPYVFNFHVGDNGHTLVYDFNSFADERGTALTNFLLASSRHFNGRLFVMDRNFTAKPLTKALGGKYYSMSAEPSHNTATPTLNPLQLEDSKRNRAFLVSWLLHFLDYDESQAEAVRELLKGVLDELYGQPQEWRSLRHALDAIANRDPSLVGQGKLRLQSVFSGMQDNLDFSTALTAFDMDAIAEHKELVVPVFSYLLHRIISTLDGTPTIIVLNEAWELLDNDFFLPRIVSLLDMLRQNNAMLLMTTRHLEDHADSYLSIELNRHAPTKIFLPDDVPADYYPEITNLTQTEVRTLMRMDRQKGDVLIKHGGEVVGCRFSMEGLDAFRLMLSGDTKALRLMQIQQR